MKTKIIGLIILFILVLLAFLLSISIGVVSIPFRSIVDAFWSFDGSREQLIVRDVRLPRALVALVVGCSLAIAGCVMQALSRNDLAGPELFGINYGAALAIVIAMFVSGSASTYLFASSALLGAALAGIFVFLLSSLGRGALTPIKLVIAGSTMNLLLASITQGILILNEQSLDTIRFWLAGSLTGREMETFWKVLPIMAIGLIGGLLISKHLNIIRLGEEMAQGLGQHVFYIKALCVAVVVLLAGSSVAIAGPIGFIGLAVSHLARAIAGHDYRWTIPYAAGAGSLLLLLADIGARFILPEQEIPVGVVTAFLGAPFLIYLAQRKERAT
ncbi:FecCD family ABC transporter permease [Paenibacillus herberti]|uniref:FecCD family ABC transporter permease n=1 Tax=Paenibacillus herberti TaxID=1619309 RepID=UPI001595EC28|nr:iron ABC transporter permease [Paenibacillus herberti]